MRRLFVFGILVTASLGLFSQTAVIKGRVYNAETNEAIPFASVLVEQLNKGVNSDIDGNYVIDGISPGEYNVMCTFVGYEKMVKFEVRVTSTKASTIDFPLKEVAVGLDEVKIKASTFDRSSESPVSKRNISATEIYRNPGGNRDISKVLQSLPGVATTSSFRNDLIVRGGAPNENRFYLDGISVPNINHFATQGSSGGPVGMINVNFIDNVDFYAGAFPVNRGNALSAVLDFKQIKGNDEKLTGTFMLGSSDVGLTLDGPMGKKSTYIFSLRRSYLQFLFKSLGLPFLPTYNDLQYKQDIRLNEKNKLTFIALGAVDDFELNQSVNESVTDSATLVRNEYILGNLPVNTQWNYTVGGKWTHYAEKGLWNTVISRSHLNNQAEKFAGNIELDSNRILDYNSGELEHQMRVEYKPKSTKINAVFGVEVTHANYTNSTFSKRIVQGNVVNIDFNSTLAFWRGAIFGQVAKQFVDNRLILSLGIRSDFANYSSEFSNPLNQFSPRFSASYQVAEKWRLNASVGRYYQLPSYTVLGYRDANNNLVNKLNGVKYIQADHAVAGIEYNPSDYAKITVEGFYKWYNYYPFLLADSISLANLGGDFGVIGNEPVTSTSVGESYGFEVLVQQRLSKSIYGIISYTYVRSSFGDARGNLVPSSWDNRHVMNLTAGKKLGKNWEVGAKFRLLGGAPYTPYDRNTTAIRNVWDVRGRAVFDWSRLNTQRLAASNGLDIRVDKRWFFKKWTLNAYLDIQNVYAAQQKLPNEITVQKDASGSPIIDPANPSRYLLQDIENSNGTRLPSIGIMVEF